MSIQKKKENFAKFTSHWKSYKKEGTMSFIPLPELKTPFSQEQWIQPNPYIVDAEVGKFQWSIPYIDTKELIDNPIKLERKDIGNNIQGEIKFKPLSFPEFKPKFSKGLWDKVNHLGTYVKYERSSLNSNMLNETMASMCDIWKMTKLDSTPLLNMSDLKR